MGVDFEDYTETVASRFGQEGFAGERTTQRATRRSLSIGETSG